MKKILKHIYLKQMFFPSLLGLVINPFYFARAGLAKSIAIFAHLLKGRLLDIGCGSKPYKKLFVVDEYVGLDIDSEITRKRNMAEVLYDGKLFPLPSNSFDSALCNQVLEHVFNPDEFLSEIYRVLKPNGKLLLTLPFVWDEHEQPYDYARYSSFGLRALLEKNGFAIRQHKKLGADATILFQLVNAYLFKVTQPWSKFAKLIFTATVMAFFNVLGVIVGKCLPDNPDLFLDHVVLVEKVS
jgi:SAM-dependent methyltransferase